MTKEFNLSDKIDDSRSHCLKFIEVTDVKEFIKQEREIDDKIKVMVEKVLFHLASIKQCLIDKEKLAGDKLI